MSYIVKKGERSGTISPPSSKSAAHRALIASALSKTQNRIIINGISLDILATANCINALFGNASVSGNEVAVSAPKKAVRETVALPCGESGTTLRFLLPIVSAMGISAVFKMEGRLAKRPSDELIAVLNGKGMNIKKKSDTFVCSGSLEAGDYILSGGVSSQFISGLLFALPLLKGNSTLTITGNAVSKGYIALTEETLRLSGIKVQKQGNTYAITGGQEYNFPPRYTVEADWSAAAPFACMGALSEEGVTLNNMDTNSLQGDKEIINILKKAGAVITVQNGDITIKRGFLRPLLVDVGDTPDIAPALAAFLSGVEGESRIVNAERLRFKESDRISALLSMLKNLGADIKTTENGLIIEGKKTIKGGKTTVFSDHRIAMAAAVAASFSQNDIIIDDTKCLNKSYVDFISDLEGLEVKK